MKQLKKCIKQLSYKKNKLDQLDKQKRDIVKKIISMKEDIALLDKDIEWLEEAICFADIELNTDIEYQNFLFDSRAKLSYEIHILINKLLSFKKKIILLDDNENNKY